MTRILALPPVDAETDTLFDLPPQPEPLPENAAPQWVLPLMRIMRHETGGDLGRAWRTLPGRLPEGTVLPDEREAAKVLLKLGLA